MKIVEAHEVKQKVMKYAFNEKSHYAVVTEGLRNGDVVSLDKMRYAYEFEIKVSKADLDKELAAIRYATITMVEGKNFAPAEDNPAQQTLNEELFKLKSKSGGYSKISKHEEYINPKAYFEKHKRYMYGYNYIPNYFYIVVPRKLSDYTIEQTKGLGYGIIAYDGCRSEDSHYGYFKDGIWYDRENGFKIDGAVWKKGAVCNDDCYKEITVKRAPRKIHDEKADERILMDFVNRACWENISYLEQIVTMEKIIIDLKGKL